MISLNKICELCGGYLKGLVHVPGWLGCSCGARRMDKEIITLSDLITSSGKYPERAQSSELTQELKENGVKLLIKINQFLKELGITKATTSSGFRTSAANAATANAAKKSLHQKCLAIDILDDKDQSLGKLILSKPELLEKYGLWIEDLNSTKGQNTNWVHLDMGSRTPRKIRSFIP